ncbi:N-acetylhexosamine 1-kinase [bioreactor metagenome]|uniref:N-acetylhexosamine 1-kinase n=1 Tax=bioreactor metagenome TaxID=1076179 RepID=A0A645B4M6_9ZZZZ|nr:aminoglycoside phosphotransferase family protein [Christensenella sp.]
MQSVLSLFALSSEPLSSEPYGSGHINGTYLVRCANGTQYILQYINTAVFRQPEALMRNIELVTEHLSKKTTDPRGVLHLIPARNGASFVVENGAYWRVYELVANSVCYQSANRVLFRECAVAFGRFQNQLSDFPAEQLVETIPHFHDTPARFSAFHEAIAANASGRLQAVLPEVDFILEREPFSKTLVSLQASGDLPLRVTHNDTKINNVLFDAATNKALCVIDLDTVMPGLSVNDFGDAIRFGASTAAEDERDLSRVHFDLDLYETYVQGYLSTCGESLTKTEIEMLPVGAKMMTLECGMRFLADHIAGDVYFHISRENQNLDRARTQIQLAREMEQHWDEMRQIVANAVNKS